MGGAHAAPAIGTGGQFQPSRGEHKTGGILHRSGSSSSSSVSVSVRSEFQMHTSVRPVRLA
jgi:hypothetical protein